MIEDFRPMMTRERVQDVQGYFVTLGAAEGQLRAQAIPALVDAGGSAAEYTAIAQWSSDWPAILGDFNPMVATMSDNVDNYDAVAALPSFDLFPWFFVVPGLLVAGSAAVALRAGRRAAAADGPGPDDAETTHTAHGAQTAAHAVDAADEPALSPTSPSSTASSTVPTQVGADAAPGDRTP
jgi:hypothetical protein